MGGAPTPSCTIGFDPQPYLKRQLDVTVLPRGKAIETCELLLRTPVSQLGTA